MDYTSFAPGPSSNLKTPPAPLRQKIFTHKFIGALLIIIALGAGASYGIYWWGNQSPQVAVPSATPDPTAGWKTYTNTQYGFSFKYPATWPFPTAYVAGSTGAVGDSFLGQAKWGYEFGIKKDIEMTLVSSYFMTAFPSSNRATILQEIKSSEQYKGGLVTIKDAAFTIAGFPAIRYDEGGLCGYPSAIVFTSSYTLKVVSNCNNENTDPFDQILSTFKFTPSTSSGQANSADTSTWKTYTNTQYGFEVKYPANLPDPTNLRISNAFSVGYRSDASGQVAQNIYRGSSDSTPNPSLVGTVQIGGLTANKFYFAEQTGPDSGPLTQYILLWQGHPLVISFSGELATNTSQIDEILSTFKFTK